MDLRLQKRAFVLSAVTVGYNVLEGVVSILAGVSAGSIALIGFGLDSFIESLSGGIMIWRFSKHETLTKDEEERIEQKAARLVASTFFVLAAYVLYESVHKLYAHETVHPSLFGIIIALISLIAMPVLFYLKYKIGKSINSKSLIADSKQTLTCMFMSAALLIGLGLNGCSPQSPLFIAGSRRTIRLTYSIPTKNPRCLRRGSSITCLDSGRQIPSPGSS